MQAPGRTFGRTASRGHSGIFSICRIRWRPASLGALIPKLEHAEIDRVRRKPTQSLDAYDYYLRGLAVVYRWTKEANNQALRFFYRAIELDPEFALAYGFAAWCYSQRKANRWVMD